MPGTIRLAAAWAAILGLAACTVSTPYRAAETSPPEGRTVYVGLTHAVLRDDRRSRALFWDYVERVEDSLPQNEGFLGFSKRVTVFGNDAWTMTVWTDEASMNAFVRSDAHAGAIRNAYGALESAHFARVEIPAEDAPLTWARALEVLASEGRSY